MIENRELTTDHYKRLIEVLGPEYIKSEVESPFDFIRIARKGINAKVINNFRYYFRLPLNSTANMLNISEPTIYRWTKSNKSLDRNFSVKLFEVADLFLYGTEIFKSKENFLKWLNLSNTALGGMEPQELLEIPGGVSKIKDVLGRIEYGVYS